MIARALSTTGPLLLGLVSVLGCRTEPERPAPTAAETSAKPPLDRLAPGELSPGVESVFGIPVPRGMQLTHKFHDLAYIEGSAPRDAVIEYVKQRVSAGRVELAENAVIFPRVGIKGQPDDRVYDVEVFSRHGHTRVAIRDVTPTPGPQGLTEAQRWERAGLSPTGELLHKDELR